MKNGGITKRAKHSGRNGKETPPPIAHKKGSKGSGINPSKGGRRSQLVVARASEEIAKDVLLSLNSGKGHGDTGVGKKVCSAIKENILKTDSETDDDEIDRVAEEKKKKAMLTWGNLFLG
jgi:hypothetical protein